MGRSFEIIGDIANVEAIATGRSIRVLKRLKRFYGEGRWRKVKGIVKVRLSDGSICKAEIHWYEMTRVAGKNTKLRNYYREN
jgi:hypothetical protein